MSEEIGDQPGSYEDRARMAPKEPKPPKEGRAKPGDEGPDPDAWMVTFSDLLTLMMTFFVLIFASQDPIQEKLQEAFGQSAGVFGRFRTSFFERIAALSCAHPASRICNVSGGFIGFAQSSVKM